MLEGDKCYGGDKEKQRGEGELNFFEVVREDLNEKVTFEQN